MSEEDQLFDFLQTKRGRKKLEKALEKVRKDG